LWIDTTVHGLTGPDSRFESRRSAHHSESAHCTDRARERRRVEALLTGVGVGTGTVQVAGGLEDVVLERLGCLVTEGLPVSDVFLLRLRLGGVDGLHPLGLGSLVVLAEHLLRELGTLVAKAVLVEGADDVGDADLSLIKETLDLAVLVDQSGGVGLLGDDPIDLAGERLEVLDRRRPGDRIGFLALEVAVSLLVLRGELDDRIVEVDSLVGPAIEREAVIGGLGPIAQARADGDPVAEDDLEGIR